MAISPTYDTVLPANDDDVDKTAFRGWMADVEQTITDVEAAAAAAQATADDNSADITALQATAGYIKERLSAARTYYVRSDGNNSNTGLANTSGAALATIQAAFAKALLLEQNGYAVTIQIGNGASLSGALSVTQAPTGPIVLDLNGGAIAATAANTSAITLAAPISLEVKGGTLSATGGSAVNISNKAARLTIGTSVTFGAVSFAHFQNSGGHIDVLGNGYTIAGNAGFSHYYFTSGGTLECSKAITVSGSRTFTFFTYAATAAALTFYGGSSFSGGSATGQRYLCEYGGIVNSFGGGASFFPGSTSGGTAQGGIYG